MTERVTSQPYIGRRGGWGAARCVYCGQRCARGVLACYRHADLPVLDPRYAHVVRRARAEGMMT